MEIRLNVTSTACGTLAILLLMIVTQPARAQNPAGQDPCEWNDALGDPALQAPEYYNDPNLVYVGVTVATENGIQMDTVPEPYKKPGSYQVIVMLAKTEYVDFRLHCETIVQFTFVRKDTRSVPPRSEDGACRIDWKESIPERSEDGVYMARSDAFQAASGVEDPFERKTCSASTGAMPWSAVVFRSTLAGFSGAVIHESDGNRER